MRTFRLVTWAAIFVLGAFLAYSTVNWTLNPKSGSTSNARADIGGAFSAVLADGTAVSEKDIRGRPHVMFFGFTHCPDVCPTTLYEGSKWLKDLGADGDKVDMYFVTVDPERDTPEILKEYLTSFDQRIKGITGSPEQISKITKAWRVFVEKVKDDDDYTINHTSTTYLMNAKGDFVRTIAYGEQNDVAVQKLRKLISEEG